MPSLEPLRAYETKLETFERWMKWAEAGHHDSILFEVFDSMGSCARSCYVGQLPSRDPLARRLRASAAPPAPRCLPPQSKLANRAALDEPPVAWW